MPRRLLFVLAALGGAAAVVLLWSGSAQAATPRPGLDVPAVPTVPVPVAPPIPKVSGAVSVPRVVTGAKHTIAGVVHHVRAAVPVALAPRDRVPSHRTTTHTSKSTSAPAHLVAVRTDMAANGPSFLRARAAPTFAVDTTPSPGVSLPAHEPAPGPSRADLARTLDEIAGTADSSTKTIGSPFALSTPHASLVRAAWTTLSFATAPVPRPGFVVGTARPG